MLGFVSNYGVFGLHPSSFGLTEKFKIVRRRIIVGDWVIHGSTPSHMANYFYCHFMSCRGEKGKDGVGF